MRTQTLIGIIGTGPLHWRADREDLSAFNPAFEGLMGDDEQLTPEEMAELTAYVATLTPPPNPFRNIDNSFAGALASGNPVAGADLFTNDPIDGGFRTCISCHADGPGTDGTVISGPGILQVQSFKIPPASRAFRQV